MLIPDICFQVAKLVQNLVAPLKKCTLSIPGIDYIASEEARSKRDAQTQAAWNFCDEMVRTNLMKRKDLPPRLTQPENLEKSTENEQQDNTGGWTIDNSRQRLNRFCMAERIRLLGLKFQRYLDFYNEF